VHQDFCVGQSGAGLLARLSVNTLLIKASKPEPKQFRQISRQRPNTHDFTITQFILATHFFGVLLKHLGCETPFVIATYVIWR
jgi:hypothetical protein